jgi:hypothetical protein
MSASGTVHLETSLTSIASLGVDHVTGGAGVSSVVVDGGLGDSEMFPTDGIPDFTSFNGLAFIDDKSHGGIVDLELADATALIESGLRFVRGNDVSLEAHDESALENSGLTLQDLGSIGIDHVETQVGTDILNIDAGVDDIEGLAALLSAFNPPRSGDESLFQDVDQVSLDIGSIKTTEIDESMLAQIKLLGIDTVTDDDGDDLTVNPHGS